MSFTDHKITQFAHRIADLPDEPQLPAADLKARFDACPEELRQSLNAVCDDAARLEARVEGIVVDTFGDTIDKEMLSDELAAELDAKATQTALASETAAREAMDERLTTAEDTISSNTNLIYSRCRLGYGLYTGNGAASQTITLGYRPMAVLIMQSGTFINAQSGTYGAFPLSGRTSRLRDGTETAEVTSTGFVVHNSEPDDIFLNEANQFYHYITLR